MIKRKNKGLSRALIILFLLTTFFTYLIPPNVQAQSDINNLALQAVKNQYNEFQDGRAVDGAYNFGAYDAYILTKAGADVSTWVYNDTSFKSSVIGLIDTTLANEGKNHQSSAKKLSQEYLIAKSWNETPKATDLLNILKNRQTAKGNGSFDDNAFSDIPTFEALGRAGDIDKIDTLKAITYILSIQDAATGAWGGGDFLTTAQAVRCLHYLKGFAADQNTVQVAIDSGLAWISQQQKEDGSFTVSSEYGGVTYWDDKVTDTADAMVTLALLGNPLDTWKSATGKSPVDYMRENALNTNGTYGDGYLSDNTQALEAYLILGANIAPDTEIGLSLTPLNAEILAGNTLQYTAKVYKMNGYSIDISTEANWSSSDNQIAAVDGNGLTSGYSAGEVDIIAVFRGVHNKVNLNVTGTSNQGNNSNNGGNQGTQVSVKVTGKNKENFFTGTVVLAPNDRFGVTALGALDKTGLSYEYDTTEYIHTIAGQGPEGKNGWMYKVNNQSPGPAVYYTVSDGQFVEWFYSLSPTNPDFPVTVGVNDEAIEVILKSYKDILLLLSKANTSDAMGKTPKVKMEIMHSDKQMSQEEAAKLQTELANINVNLNKTIGSEETVIGNTEVSMLVPENALSLTKTITVTELTANNEPKQFAIRLASATYEFGPSGTKFDKPVTIALKAPITKDLDIKNLTPAWYDETQKEWIPIPGVIDLQSGLVVFQTDHFTKFALIQLPEAIELPEVIKAPDRITFTDVNDEIAWAKDAIEILAGMGIISGTGPGLFEPQRLITRAEFVKLLVTALQLETEEYKNGLFIDVDSSNWFASSVATAYQNKLVLGYPDSSFRPSNHVSRNEIASIFYQIEGASKDISDVTLDYKDLEDIPAWAVNGARFAYKHGFMNGYEDGTFKGDRPLSRAEAAVVIYKYLNASSKL